MKYKSVLTRIMIAPLFLGLVTSCYDLGELNENPYEIKDATVGGNDTDTGDDGTKYSDINIDFKVSKEDSLALQSELASAASTFRNFIYEGYYNDYQITTNLSHDIYAGYVANNQKNHAGNSPDYNYTDGWSGKRWEHFYNDRSNEYRRLLRAFKFNDEPERYKNAFYMTRIYYAFLALAQTDTYGDMPFDVYVRARVPETDNIPYNTQEQVYDMMFRMLEQAVDSIDVNDANQYSFGAEDICYFGDAKKWVRFANTLRLRMALRISNVDPDRARTEGMAALNAAQKAGDSELGLMMSNEDNMCTVPKFAPKDMGGMDEGGSENPLAMCSVAYNGESVLSWDLEQFYKNLSVGGGEYQIRTGRNNYITKIIDPRCLVCWYRPSTMNALESGVEDDKNDFTGCKRGYQDVNQASGDYSLTRTKMNRQESKILDPKYWFNYARPTVWLGYAESLFLKAEAVLRGWTGAEINNSVEGYFKAGIQASMDYYLISQAEATSYINGLKIYQEGETNPFSGSDKEAILEQIITQKWMAVFPNGNEGWADFRRTDYPRLANQLTNNSGGSVPNGKHIKRLLYPLSEVNNKTEQRPTQIDTEGSRLWWDVADTNNDAGERNKPNNFRSATLSKLKF